MQLVERIKRLNDEVKVVMESTGAYHFPAPIIGLGKGISPERQKGKNYLSISFKRYPDHGLRNILYSSACFRSRKSLVYGRQDPISILTQMRNLASELPEYEVVISMLGIGKILAVRIIAETGDVRRFHSGSALVAYAGLDAPPHQSGSFVGTNRHISERGR